MRADKIIQSLVRIMEVTHALTFFATRAMVPLPAKARVIVNGLIILVPPHLVVIHVLALAVIPAPHQLRVLGRMDAPGQDWSVKQLVHREAAVAAHVPAAQHQPYAWVTNKTCYDRNPNSQGKDIIDLLV